MSDAEGLVLGSPFKSCLGRRPKADGAENSEPTPAEPLPPVGLWWNGPALTWRHQMCFQSSQRRQL